MVYAVSWLSNDNIAIDLYHLIFVIGFSVILVLLSNIAVATLKTSQITITIPPEQSGKVSTEPFKLLALEMIFLWRRAIEYKFLKTVCLTVVYDRFPSLS